MTGGGGRPFAFIRGGAAPFGCWFYKGCGGCLLLFARSPRIHSNHSARLIAVQPLFSTIRCKTLNIFIKVCYPLPDVAAMLEDSDPVGTPRRLLDPSSNARTPGNSSHFGTHLPRSIFFSFHTLTGTPFCNPFVFRFMQEWGVYPPPHVRTFRPADVQTYSRKF